MTLKLSPDTGVRLQRKAKQATQSVPEYLIAVAEATMVEKDAETSEGSAYDLFAGRIGLLRSGGYEQK